MGKHFAGDYMTLMLQQIGRQESCNLPNPDIPVRKRLNHSGGTSKPPLAKSTGQEEVR